MTSEKSVAPDESSPSKYSVGNDESVVEAILAAVEKATGKEAPDTVEEAIASDGDVDYPPLYEVVDPDALALFLESASRNGGAGRVSFSYCGRSVTVTAAGTVEVTRQERNRDEVGD